MGQKQDHGAHHQQEPRKQEGQLGSEFTVARPPSQTEVNHGRGHGRHGEKNAEAMWLDELRPSQGEPPNGFAIWRSLGQDPHGAAAKAW